MMATFYAGFTRFNGELYAGGAFQQLEGVTTGSVAAFNGVTWRALSNSQYPNGLPSQAFSLAVSGSSLYAAGWYMGWSDGPLEINDGGSVARWDGTGWSGVGYAYLANPIVAIGFLNGVLVSTADRPDGLTRAIERTHG